MNETGTSMRWCINALPGELRTAAEFCRQEGLGLEVTAFAFPRVLDEGIERQLVHHQEHLEGLKPLSFHGPYLDLYAASPDPEIVKVCQVRHEAALSAAEKLRVQLYVAHLNFVPLIRNPDYRSKFVERTASFYRSLAQRASDAGITIVLENMWEPDPSLQIDVLQAVDHPALKASLDNGHALLFSTVTSAEWARQLGKDLYHCHLHDNDGNSDQHAAVGTGKKDWKALLEALKLYCPNAIRVLESDYLDANRDSWQRAVQFAVSAVPDGGKT